MKQKKEYSRLLSISDSLYRVILFLYPSKFRSEFGPDMARTFSDCSRDAFLRQGAGGLLWIWISHLFDLIKTVFEQHILESDMDKSSQQTTVIGGILAAIGLIILSSQFSYFTTLTWSMFLASVGAITIVLYLRDRSHRWLMFTSYVLWVIAITLCLADAAVRPEAWINKILPVGFKAEELLVPFILSVIGIPSWVGYFKNKKREYLITAYFFSVILLVILSAFYTSGEFIFSLILYAAAVPMLFSYFKEQNHSLLVPGYLLTAFATCFSIGMGLDLHLYSSNAMIYALGGGSIISGLGLFALRPQIKKTNPHAVVQLMVIGGIIVILGGIMLFAVPSELSVQTVYFVLGSIGILTGAWYFFDRSRTWLGMTSYVTFFIFGIIYINVGDGSLNVNPQYIAPFIFGSIGVLFLLAYFRNTNKQGALITGYVFSVFAGFLLLAFSNFFNGILIPPYISFAIGLPFIFTYIRNKTRWTLIPGYVILSLGVALLLGSIIQEATSLEGAFQYAAAGFMVLAGLGMQVLRPMLKEQAEAG
jgi:hypothetical protein